MALLTPIQLGGCEIELPLMLAPMAGVTDKPTRDVCRQNGAGYTVGEMLTSDQSLWSSRKSARRMDIVGETGLTGMQIAGSDPAQMADAAKACVDRGARVIDINMGCPAKKVCRRWAGSALLQDERLVGQILHAVVNAVDVPVTLKIRTGWHRDHVNGEDIARIAESSGIAMLAVHGRTRDMLYKGDAEHKTAAKIKRVVSIPVIVNGDIDSPERAHQVLLSTSADGLMVGRGAQGRPWIFQQIADYFQYGSYRQPSKALALQTMLAHINAIHQHYGEVMGVRIARKHLGWYAAATLTRVSEFRREVMQQTSAAMQLTITKNYFEAEPEDFLSTRSATASA